jgi:hypothetical protein
MPTDAIELLHRVENPAIRDVTRSDEPIAPTKDLIAMISLRKTLHQHHQVARTRRLMNRAIDHAGTPAVRNELLTIAQHQGLSLR